MVNNSQLRTLNPWWRARENIKSDAEITKWTKSIIRYDPRLRHMIRYDYGPDNTVIYTLRGTRQVGKTTLIKLQIRDFLYKKGACPWNIFYYSFDNERSSPELVEVVEAYLRLSKKYRKEHDRTYLFLDEASSINDWQKGIKSLVDGSRLKNCTVLVTGSRADSILRAAERLPGRRGRTTEAYDKLLIPMKFAEFVGIRNEEIKQFADDQLLELKNRKRVFSQFVSGDIPKEIDLLYNNFVDDLNYYLYEYMLTGGTPRIVDEKVRTNFIAPDLYTRYLDGLKGDWAPRSETLLKQFANAIVASMGSATSWNKLRENAQLASWATVEEYAHLLKDLTIISIVQRYNAKRQAPLIQKEKKLYFHDPFYLHMFNGWAGAKDPFELSENFLDAAKNRGAVVEGIVSNHLVRWAFSTSQNRQTFDYLNHLFFWKDEKNREVDFILYQNDREVPIEVKYRDHVDTKDLGGLVGFLDQTGAECGLVLSKDRLERRQDYLIIPASVFLMSI